MKRKEGTSAAASLVVYDCEFKWEPGDEVDGGITDYEISSV